MKPILKAAVREKSSRAVQQIRREGFIPGVVYGKGIPNILVKVESDPFQRIFREAGEHTLVDLDVGAEEKRTVLIHDVALDPIKGTPIHVDFYQVRLNEKVTTEIPLTFSGTSKAVKDLGGTLVRAMHAVKVEALPDDIPHEIEVDVSKIDTFEDHIVVRDLRLNPGVKILAEPDETVALVEPPRGEEELAELKEEVVENVEAVEGVKEEKEKSEELKKEEKETPES